MLALSVFLAAINSEADRERFAIFYQKYRNYSLQVAYYILHSKSDAEDAVQKAFAYLIDKPEKLLEYEEKSTKFYLALLVKDYAKGIIRENKHFADISQERYNAEVLEKAMFEMADNAKGEDVRWALRDLEPFDQVLIRLYYYDKYKTKEIAKMYHMSDANVRKRLQRARIALKESLESSRKEEVYE